MADDNESQPATPEQARLMLRDAQVTASRVNLALIDLRAKLASFLSADYPGVSPAEDCNEVLDVAYSTLQTTVADLDMNLGKLGRAMEELHGARPRVSSDKPDVPDQF